MYVPIKLKAMAVLRNYAVHRQQRAPYDFLNLAKQAVRSVVAQCRGEADAQTGKRTDLLSIAPAVPDSCSSLHDGSPSIYCVVLTCECICTLISRKQSSEVSETVREMDDQGQLMRACAQAT